MGQKHRTCCSFIYTEKTSPHTQYEGLSAIPASSIRAYGVAAGNICWCTALNGRKKRYSLASQEAQRRRRIRVHRTDHMARLDRHSRLWLTSGVAVHLMKTKATHRLSWRRDRFYIYQGFAGFVRRGMCIIVQSIMSSDFFWGVFFAQKVEEIERSRFTLTHYLAQSGERSIRLVHSLKYEVLSRKLFKGRKWNQSSHLQMKNNQLFA